MHAYIPCCLYDHIRLHFLLSLLPCPSIPLSVSMSVIIIIVVVVIIIIIVVVVVIIIIIVVVVVVVIIIIIIITIITIIIIIIVTNCILFCSTPELGALAPFVFEVCGPFYTCGVRPWHWFCFGFTSCSSSFSCSSCPSVLRVPLFHVSVSEVLVSLAIGSPEYRRIQRRLWRSQLTIVNATFVLVEGREAWLAFFFILFRVVVGFNEIQFSVWAWADDIFLNRWSYVVSGTQTSGWIFFVL